MVKFLVDTFAATFFSANYGYFIVENEKICLTMLFWASSVESFHLGSPAE